MTPKKLLTSLMLGTALAVTGCNSNTAETETKTEAAMKDMGTRMASNVTDAPALETHLWLEEVEGEDALAKVREWNAASAAILQDESYEALNASLLDVYNSPEKIPYVSYRAGLAHNFWQDENHVRGIWRATTLDSYASETTEWDTILDFDALAESEDKNWVYKGNSCLAPDYNRCIVRLSDGGKDAVTRREFDVPSKSFVNDGFDLPESKGFVDWLDADTLIVGIDFGPGTMTESGYPRIVKMLKRGMTLDEAETLYEGDPAHVGSWGYTFEDASGDKELMLQNSLSFFEREYFWLKRTDAGFEQVPIPIPNRSSFGDQFKGQRLLLLQEDWRGHKTGSLVSFSITDFLEDGQIDQINELFSPGERQTLNSYGVTKDKVLVSISENVTGSGWAYDFVDGKWMATRLDLPKNGSVSIGGTNDKESIAFISTESFLNPDTLWSIDTSSLDIQKVKSLPNWFDASDMSAEQFEATSDDGTKIPYFVIRKKGLEMDGSNPTVLYGYGGFQVSLTPSYSGTIGRGWLEKGGVYVLANIRGGGEFGPDWHQAGLKEKRQVIYDDFISVAEDLIDRDITSPGHLGIHGGSNGGLLMGVMMTQRPDLFNAIAIGVPLLDMQRYHTLLAGASWVGEYGDPDDDGAEGAFIRNLSPYHNLKTGVEYPEPFIYTSTKDDRVHPGHARKYAQRLEDLGLPFQYYENIDGGHASAANLKESAHKNALIYNYFYSKLK